MLLSKVWHEASFARRPFREATLASSRCNGRYIKYTSETKMYLVYEGSIVLAVWWVNC